MAIEQVLKDLGAATAYAYAVEKGYTGTEEEFATLMASYASVAQSAAASATAAAGSATSAASSASTASAAASTATTKASEASTSATNAAGSASSAASSASAASGSATSAAASATTASGKASEAATAATTATTAKTDAVTAKTAAQAAQTAAETAQGKAETAQEAAEDAAESVSASAAQIATNTSDISDLKEELTQKANIDGSYEDLVSGGAYQIISNMEETDAIPYTYRTAGGSLEIGDREKLKKIVGGSLAVNQLVYSCIYIQSSTSESNGIVTITPSAASNRCLAGGQGGVSGIDIVQNHIYLQSVVIKSDGTNPVGFQNYANPGDMYLIDKITSATWTNLAKIGKAMISGRCYVQIWSPNVTEYQIKKNSFNLIDLTAMFGTTIADYVYSLETATAGAGVAWLKAHFPRIFDAGYIPYNAGTLEHVSGLSAHKMTGFNQWDEEWEITSINWNTRMFTPSASGGRLSSKNYIPVLPNTTYYINKYVDNYIAGYDNDNPTNGYNIVIDAGRFTTPSNCHFIKFGLLTNNYGKTYKNDICINLHWDGERDGEYEPYEEHVYPLDSDVTLRGIYKLDANNQLYADGDEYASDGTVNRRYGIVDLGTLNYVYESSVANTHFLTGGVNMPKRPKYKGALMSDLYIWKPNGSYSNIGNMEMCVDNSESTPVLRIKNDSYDNVTTFKTAMSGVYLVYELDTPTTESGAPYTEEQITNNWGTEEFVSECLVPVGHETGYQPDLRAKIEVAPESPDTDGMYLMKRENGQNSYVAYLGELPSDPSEDGTYTLKCTVASGTATKTWEADE